MKKMLSFFYVFFAGIQFVLIAMNEQPPKKDTNKIFDEESDDDFYLIYDDKTTQEAREIFKKLVGKEILIINLIKYPKTKLQEIGTIFLKKLLPVCVKIKNSKLSNNIIIRNKLEKIVALKLTLQSFIACDLNSKDPIVIVSQLTVAENIYNLAQLIADLVKLFPEDILDTTKIRAFTYNAIFGLPSDYCAKQFQ